MIIGLPITWFVLLSFWSHFILKKKINNIKSILSLLFVFISHFYSVVAMNRAIDIVDFSLKDGLGFNFWFYSSLLSFILGLSTVIYLQFKKN